MASFVGNIVFLAKYPFSQFRAPSLDGFTPKVPHRVLGEEYISQFKEIFVIGDVHGCKHELDELLKISGAKSNSILKIFVGDMINKGTYNLEVLDYLRNNASVLCVRGNHEEIVLETYFMTKVHGHSLESESAWIRQLTDDDLKYLKDLPYTISIPSLNVIVVHAGLIPGRPLSLHKPIDLVTMRNLIITNEYFGDEGIKSTKYDTEGEAWATLWPGPEHVFFGHDAKRKLQLEQFATGLDTGCVYGGSLTGIFISGPRDGAFVHVKPKRTYREPKSKKTKKKIIV